MNTTTPQIGEGVRHGDMNGSTSSAQGHQGELEVPEGCVVLSAGDFIPWANPDNLVSQEVERTVDVAVATVFLPVLFLISIPTNLLNAAVFWKHGLGERINLCLFCLSLADLIYMLHSFLINVDRLHLLPAGEESSQLGPVFLAIVDHQLMGFRGFSWVSGFLSTLAACERCMCVLSPLTSRTVLRTGTTAVIIALCSMMILAGFCLVCTRWNVTCVFDPVANTTVSALYGSHFYTRHRRLLDALDGIVYGLVLPALYLTVVTLTTALTLWKLRQSAEWRHHTSSSSSTSGSGSGSGSGSAREVALTRMLVGVSVLYVVCTVPTLVLGVCIVGVAEFSLRGRYYNAFNLMVSVFEFFSYINASFNFFVYCFLGSRYRQTLSSVVCCRTLADWLAHRHRGRGGQDVTKTAVSTP